MKTNSLYDKILYQFSRSTGVLASYQVERWGREVGCSSESAGRIARMIAKDGEKRRKGARVKRLTLSQKLERGLRTKFTYYLYYRR